MKILQINAVYNVGSTGVIVSDLHKLSEKEGIESFVAYSTSHLPNHEILNGYRIGNVLDKKLHALLCRINGEQAYFSSFATKRFLKYVDRISPDIVHLHNLHSNYINLNMLLDYLGKRNIKTVITLHDCWYFTGGCFYYTAENCDKWMNGCGDCPKKHKDTRAYVFDRSSKILKDRKTLFSGIRDLTVVGVSNWIANEANRTFLGRNKAFTIYNGIDTEFFTYTASDLKERYGIEDKFVVLGLASKWLKEVNRETFDYFVSNLSQDCAFVLLGCTRSQAKRLPKSVVSIPFVKDRDELKKVYSIADVFVNCTREDCLPTVNIEAQSCGTPVVAYSNTGTRETISDEYGFSVENGNVKELFNATMYIKKLGKNSISDKVRTWTVDKFNRDGNFQKYIKMYKEIAKCEE